MRVIRNLPMQPVLIRRTTRLDVHACTPVRSSRSLTLNVRSEAELARCFLGDNLPPIKDM